MEKKEPISFDELLKEKHYHDLTDLLFDLERERYPLDKTNARYDEIRRTTKSILKELSLNKLAWVLLQLSRLPESEIKAFRMLREQLKEELNERLTLPEKSPS